MTFVAPAFFLASLAVAAAVVALHFIVTRQPRSGILPTARFVPDLPAKATARSTRPSDLLLLALRVLLVLLVGAGLARPVLKPARYLDARVILVDVSRAVGNIQQVRDSARAHYREQDVLIAFDSMPRFIGVDSLATISVAQSDGSLSAAVIAALRAASGLRDVADSVELVIVSPFAANEADAATTSIRSLWKGRARLVEVGRPTEDVSLAQAAQVVVQGGSDDPLAVTARLASARANATVVREGLAGPGDASSRIHWPREGRPERAVARAQSDTVGALLAGNELVVAPFARRWRYPSDSVGQALIVARWNDGEAAALEIPQPGGCRRSVAVPVTAAGDLPIRRDFIRLFETLTGACAGGRPFAPMATSEMSTLRGSGGLAFRDSFAAPDAQHSGYAPWLITAALVLATLELFVRRRTGVSERIVSTERGEMESAA